MQGGSHRTEQDWRARANQVRHATGLLFFDFPEACQGFIPLTSLYTVRVCSVKEGHCKFKTYTKHKVYILYEEMGVVQQKSIFVVAGLPGLQLGNVYKHLGV